MRRIEKGISRLYVMDEKRIMPISSKNIRITCPFNSPNIAFVRFFYDPRYQTSGNRKIYQVCLAKDAGLV